VHSSSNTVPRTCSRCGVRPARFYPITWLGALCLAERALCEECDADELSEAEKRGPPAEGDFTILGPIQFGTLLASLPDAARAEPTELLHWYAARVREIARAHGQSIPAAVESYLAQFEAARDGSDTA
jgi:hypothetical protein